VAIHSLSSIERKRVPTPCTLRSMRSRSRHRGSSWLCCLVAILGLGPSLSSRTQISAPPLEIVALLPPPDSEDLGLLMKVKNTNASATQICTAIGHSVSDQNSGTGVSMTHACDSPRSFVVVLAGESLFVSLGKFTATESKQMISIRLSVVLKPVLGAGAPEFQQLRWSGTMVEARQAFKELFGQ
jgi:hypothetical protein